MADNAPVSLNVDVPAYALVYDKKGLKIALRAAGAEIAAVTRAMIRAATGGGRKYRGPGGSSAYRGGYKKGAYTASAAGAPPVSVSGTLARSLKVLPFKSGEGVAVREAVFYAKFLGTGAKGGGFSGAKLRLTKGGRVVKSRNVPTGNRTLEPRPSLAAAIEARGDSITSRLTAAASEGVKFQRLKP